MYAFPTATTDPWTPLGRALADEHAGRRRHPLLQVNDVGIEHQVCVEDFFRPFEFCPDPEPMAVDLCRGRVLDVGAAAGCHARELERRGVDVVALDVSPHATRVLRARGVTQVIRGDVFSLEGGPFDTVLLLMNGIGVVGTVDGYDRLLARLPGLLAPGGQVLFDTADIRVDPGEEGERGIRARVAEGRYPGEIWQQLHYGAAVGEPCPWLFLDPDTAVARARSSGFDAQVLYEGGEGEALVRLVRMDGTTVATATDDG